MLYCIALHDSSKEHESILQAIKDWDVECCQCLWRVSCKAWLNWRASSKWVCLGGQNEELDWTFEHALQWENGKGGDWMFNVSTWTLDVNEDWIEEAEWFPSFDRSVLEITESSKIWENLHCSPQLQLHPLDVKIQPTGQISLDWMKSVG